ncbi:hypothetical protein [Clostridium estertheticum]|uniref:Uncharacterized protein n=2 Tax=Clostridium estertheticum TaxID=238834 RepID=A0A1J0GIH3_9CLOT|nr:hypothetical protein [Clostridium estertheticum]APC40718.1 hypothetical protein A7L45_11835 [Clostridium estertheticum subsp. estertheticum]MBU3074310.1 hypothetical protein [Clostridium estertheticum]MBU3164404.1 hypothetical protein [Clostridium estertheticum]MBU3170945.1 hypothetical protein [Clostridium estertheticum]MBU3184411.1 hypothetical protein [Clostridium estertheticum]
MNWKEELVLQFRNMTIDRTIISKAMQNFVDVFNGNLDKYNIKNIRAITDLNEYIDIKFYKKVCIKYTDDNVTFILFNKDGIEQNISIKLSIAKKVGGYFLQYINTEERNPKLKAFIDENIIDGILQDLFELNEEVISIK